MQTAGAAARPPAPAPNVSGTSSEPPPAWFSAAGRDGWFAYHSFCWTTACVDFLPPDRRTDVPAIRARDGERIGLHLGFEPKSVAVRVLATGTRYSLVARRDTSWRVRGAGLIAVEVRAAQGTAAYLARVTR